VRQQSAAEQETRGGILGLAARERVEPLDRERGVAGAQLEHACQ
jgi:hypothetical protein